MKRQRLLSWYHRRGLARRSAAVSWPLFPPPAAPSRLPRLSVCPTDFPTVELSVGGQAPPSPPPAAGVATVDAFTHHFRISRLREQAAPHRESPVHTRCGSRANRPTRRSCPAASAPSTTSRPPPPDTLLARRRVCTQPLPRLPARRHQRQRQRLHRPTRCA